MRYDNRVVQMARRIASSVYSASVAAVLPATCAGCARIGDWICMACQSRLSIDHIDGCRRCGHRGSTGSPCSRCEKLFPPRLKQVRAGFVYDGVMRRAVQRFKYHGEYRRGHDLGARLCARLDEDKLLPAAGIDLVVPVPLHARRLRMRGFNQAEILAGAVSERLDAKVIPGLIRTRDTHPQVRLHADQRYENVQHAFEVNEVWRDLIKDARVLVVDDVMTTGATLGSAATVLERSGATMVYGLTLARDR